MKIEGEKYEEVKLPKKATHFLRIVMIMKYRCLSKGLGLSTDKLIHTCSETYRN